MFLLAFTKSAALFDERLERPAWGDVRPELIKGERGFERARCVTVHCIWREYKCDAFGSDVELAQVVRFEGLHFVRQSPLRLLLAQFTYAAVRQLVLPRA